MHTIMYTKLYCSYPCLTQRSLTESETESISNSESWCWKSEMLKIKISCKPVHGHLRQKNHHHYYYYQPCVRIEREKRWEGAGRKEGPALPKLFIFRKWSVIQLLYWVKELLKILIGQNNSSRHLLFPKLFGTRPIARGVQEVPSEIINSYNILPS